MTGMFFAFLLALLYSIAYTVAGPATAAQEMGFDSSMFFAFVLCFIVCAAVNFLIFFLMPRLQLCAGKGRISRHLNRYLDRVGSRRLFFSVWAFIFAAWMPAWLVLYPGVLSYDMISQVGSALGEITNNHHPVLHTWLIRFFMEAGDTLFSGYEYGIGLLTLLQMLILSYALTRLVFLLKKKKVPILLVILTALLSAFWYMNACLSVTIIKDNLHAAFLVLFVCHFTEIAVNPAEYSRRKVNFIFLPLIGFLMCAFRNNGIHIYVFCFAGLLVLKSGQICRGFKALSAGEPGETANLGWYKQVWGRRTKEQKAYLALTAAILLPVVLFKIYTGPVFDAFGIAQGQVREALSVPIQQLQRVAVMRADVLTEEQTERMSYYIDNLEWREPPSGRAYLPFCADPAKACFYSERYEEDPIAFWKFYLQTGKQFSKEYLAAFLSNSLGYWYPGYYEFSYVMYENYPPEMFAEPLERKTIWDSQILKKYYESVCNSGFWRKTPVLRLFFVPGFTLWFLLYGLALAWKKRGFFTKVLPLFLPLTAQYGIMILSPISSFRYAWPFYLMLPLTFICIWGNLES